jgi:acetylornithine deacetylase/succinyl-diaminopimelate desuccinylase-like protein
MPRVENAAVLAAEAIARLSAPYPTRLTDVTRQLLDKAIEALDGEIARVLQAVRAGAIRATDRPLPDMCLPIHGRALDATLRDTLSANVVRAGVKFNVIPGEAVLELDCRRLPGTTAEAMEASIRERLGPELEAVTDVELLIESDPVVADHTQADGLYPILEAVIRDHDPDGVPLPAMAPYSTDAKHLLSLGVPTFGFSPLRQPPDETYLERWHGVDERVSVDGLRWGLPVLYDAVRRFCGMRR